MVPYGPMMKLSKPKKAFKRIRKYYSNKESIRSSSNQTKSERAVNTVGKLAILVSALILIGVILFKFFGPSREEALVNAFVKNELATKIDNQKRDLNEICKLLATNYNKLSYLRFNRYNQSFTLKIEHEHLSKVKRPWELYELRSKKDMIVSIERYSLVVQSGSNSDEISQNWVYTIDCKKAKELDPSILEYLGLKELEFEELLRHVKAINHPISMYPDSTIVAYKSNDFGMFTIKYSGFKNPGDVQFITCRNER